MSNLEEDINKQINDMGEVLRKTFIISQTATLQSVLEFLEIAKENNISLENVIREIQVSLDILNCD